MERNRENAQGDLTTAFKEFGLDVEHAELRVDEFGRLPGVLFARVGKMGTNMHQIYKAAIYGHEVFVGLGWVATLHIDGESKPWITVKLEA